MRIGSSEYSDYETTIDTATPSIAAETEAATPIQLYDSGAPSG